jgi:hypothetical protein
MRSLLIGAALLAFGSCGAFAQQSPDPNASITTPSTPAPAVNSPADTSMKTKMMHHGSRKMHHRHVQTKHGRHMRKSNSM